MKILCVSGKAETGKDTVATMFKVRLEKDNYKVIIVRFADPLKAICTDYFGWNGEKDEVGRTLLQEVGDKIREKDEDFFVDFIGRLLLAYEQDYDYAIIADLRFKNELEKIGRYFEDVQHIRVLRPKHQSTLTPEQQAHKSEVDLDDIKPDFYIHNEDDKKMLETRVNVIVRAQVV